jgi:hypothetical protein
VVTCIFKSAVGVVVAPAPGTGETSVLRQRNLSSHYDAVRRIKKRKVRGQWESPAARTGSLGSLGRSKK